MRSKKETNEKIYLINKVGSNILKNKMKTKNENTVIMTFLGFFLACLVLFFFENEKNQLLFSILFISSLSVSAIGLFHFINKIYLKNKNGDLEIYFKKEEGKLFELINLLDYEDLANIKQPKKVFEYEVYENYIEPNIQEIIKKKLSLENNELTYFDILLKIKEKESVKIQND